MATNVIFRNARIGDNFNKLLAYMHSRTTSINERRSQYETTDREVERENMRDPRSKALVRLNSAGDKTKLRNTTVPVIAPAYDAALAYFHGVFLDGYPIFSVVSDREHEDVATGMQALMARDQNYFKWVRQLQLAFGDGLRYNLMATETLWKTVRETRVRTGNNAGSTNTAQMSAEQYAGNCIERLDPYNVFYDESVSPADVATEGDYVGYIEHVTFAQLKNILLDMPNEYKNIAILSQVLAAPMSNPSGSTGQSTFNYYIPSIRLNRSRGDSQDFRTFFDTATGAPAIGGAYERVVAYVRIIPKSFGLIVPNAGQTQIYKGEWINGRCIFIQPMLDAHGLFPINLCQPIDDGIGALKKSFCEGLIDFQDSATSLQSLRFQALRRGVSDRALFDTSRVKEADVNSENPAAKIPVRMNALNRDLASAYHAIPYRDEMGQTYSSEMQMQMRMAQEAGGINPAMAGNFQKGNRTMQEFDRTVDNAQAKLQLRAQMIEQQLMTDIKYIMRSNYLQYAINENVFEKSSKKVISIDPVQMREAELSFTVTDGMLPASKVMSADMINHAITAVTQLPTMAQTYDVAGMVVSILKGGGFTNLDDYKLEKPNAATPATAPGTVAAPADPTAAANP